jgi:phytoene dehydrogenase-like protein
VALCLRSISGRNTIGGLLASEMTRRTWDAVVVGAGHNGLAAAGYLARAGRTVLVLERRDQVGGACTLEEPWPGYAISPCAYLAGLLHPKVVEDLELHRFGYELIPLRPEDPYITVPFEDGSAFTEWIEHARTVAELSEEDARGYEAYVELNARMRDALRPAGERDMWLGEPPSRDELEDRLGGDEVAIATLFEDSMVTTLERFFSQRVVDALAAQGCIGTFASPYDPGTSSVSFHHGSGRLTPYPGAWTYVRGGMGMVSFALRDSAVEAGAAVATGVTVAAIRPGEGVELDDGTLVRATTVISNADPRRALALLDGSAPDEFRRRVEAVPQESPVFKVNFALRELPTFPQADHAVRGTVNVTRGARALQESVEAARAGRVSDELWCELYCQTAADPSVAPAGRHVMSAFCQWVPYRLADGTWDERRDEIADRVESSIERFAPGFRDLVLEREALAPPDVEEKIGLTGGHIFQGEILPEHMWDRRLPYRTGADGVYLCGVATYPGGSVIGVNGRNAALAVLADRW